MSDLIGAYVRHLKAAGFSPETRDDRRCVLSKADRELPNGLDHAVGPELEDWLGNEGWARWTLYTYYHHLSGLYAWALRAGRLPRNPMDGLIRPRPPSSEPRPASEDQLVVALGLPRPWRIAVVLAAAQGLRCAEIARLGRQDVTAEWMPVLRKGEKTQVLPTHERVWEEIADLPPGPLVPRPDGGHHDSDQLSGAMSYRLRRAGLPGVTLHWFRHRYATQTLLPEDLGGAGADIRTVQDLLGHKSVASTQIYTQVTNRQRRAAIAGLTLPRAVQ